MTSKEKLEKVMYSYTAETNPLEDENKLLRETINGLKNELDRYRQPPLMVCEVKEAYHDKTALVKVPNGNEFFVTVSRECGPIKAGDSVLAEQKNLTVVKRIDTTKNFSVEQFVIVEKPDVSWGDIGGLDGQAREIQEVIELPLKNPDLFKRVGIQPPKGILLYGPPGTGKTLLAKAVAASTNSTFIEIVGSELIQKFIGEGAKLVKEIFQLAREKAPSIIFIDELDALAARRIEVGTSGEREVQRTFMQFLAEIDGFKHLGNVKVIGCTNRKDILDPAVLRPGRLDRLIHVDNPNKEAREQIFMIHTRTMNLDRDISLPKVLARMDGFSGAEVKAACTEAGYFAIRRYQESDFEERLVGLNKKIRECQAQLRVRIVENLKGVTRRRMEAQRREVERNLELTKNRKYRLLAQMKRGMVISEKDILDGIEKVKQEEEREGKDYLRMFG
ncbi:AAA family ATPase [Candidatus Woesearchaeota archaeon]|nr:AAA family ATPase [Candidatus Woesearchaeota archaeon]